VVEPGAPDRRDHAAVEVAGKVDPADLDAQRPSDRANLE